MYLYTYNKNNNILIIINIGKFIYFWFNCCQMLSNGQYVIDLNIIFFIKNLNIKIINQLNYYY